MKFAALRDFGQMRASRSWRCRGPMVGGRGDSSACRRRSSCRRLIVIVAFIHQLGRAPLLAANLSPDKRRGGTRLRASTASISFTQLVRVQKLIRRTSAWDAALNKLPERAAIGIDHRRRHHSWPHLRPPRKDTRSLARVANQFEFIWSRAASSDRPAGSWGQKSGGQAGHFTF